MKTVIIGGVAGGASAAARIRRLDENAEIVMLERSGYVSYANCGLPYYIGGVITKEKALTLQTPQSFKSRFNVDVRVRNEATAIDPKSKTVTVRNLETGEIYTESYDKLLLSPGARPTVPSFDGAESLAKKSSSQDTSAHADLPKRVFSLRTVEDTFLIHEFVEREKPKTAVLAGGGFIGLEMAENLALKGIRLTIVQRPNQVLAPLDEDMASFAHVLLRSHGIALKLGSSVSGFVNEGDSVTTMLRDETPLQSDMVILAIGVTPDTGLAKAAGLKLGVKGSIVVNERMETSEPDIYAVGDAVEVRHFVTGREAVIPLAGPANKQGRIAADNICGGDSRFTGSQGSSIVKLFDMTFASTGINEKTAAAAGLDCDKVILSPAGHATYYPGAKAMVMKVLYEKKTQRLLGAQIAGYDGVDKRIDVIATAIHAGLTATALAELDLAYAPPYSSAKDPVNMAGFMAENIENGLVKQFDCTDVPKLQQNVDAGKATLLDIRTVPEYRKGHIDKSLHIPLDSLREHLSEISKDKPIYIICQSGLRSYIACRLLSQHGYDCYNLAGGYSFYRTVMLDKQMKAETYPCGMEKEM